VAGFDIVGVDHHHIMNLREHMRHVRLHPFETFWKLAESRDISDDIATRLWAGQSGF
jgi:hypothetical protein